MSTFKDGYLQCRSDAIAAVHKLHGKIVETAHWERRHGLQDAEDILRALLPPVSVPDMSDYDAAIQGVLSAAERIRQLAPVSVPAETVTREAPCGHARHEQEREHGLSPCPASTDDGTGTT